MGRRITSPDMTPAQRADIARRVARVMKDDPTKTEMEALRMVFDGTDGPDDELPEPKNRSGPSPSRSPIEQVAIQSAEQDIVCPSAHCASGGRVQFRDGRFICTRCREHSWSLEDGLMAARMARGARAALAN